MAENDRATIVAERLRIIQARRDLTIQEMAERCNIPKRSLENYMNLKAPQRPGLDALLSVSEGMEVSVDWLVGRSRENWSRVHTYKEYAIACHHTVATMLNDLCEAQASSEEPVVKDRTIMGKPAETIAAGAMFDFIDAIANFEGQGPFAQDVRASLFESVVEDERINQDRKS